MPTRRAAAPLAILVLGLAVAAVPPGPAMALPALQATTHVHMENTAFNPDPVAILVGDTITWDNHDVAPHTVTADDASFDSGVLDLGESYTRTFNQVGSIPYHCDIHPVSMTGTIIVTDPNALPDLVVSGLTFTDNLPGVDKRIEATVRNLGDGLAGESTVRIAYAYQGGEVTIGEVDVPLLGPRGEFTTSVSWRVLGKVGDFEVRVHADADGDVAEASEANNVGSALTSVLVPGVPGIDLLDPLAG